MKKTEQYFNSSNGTDRVVYHKYEPDYVEPKAVIQLVHGMAEYVERYEEFIEYLTAKGFVVYGDNHIGHKGSVKNDDELGYFAPQNGWNYLVEDEKQMTDIIRNEYPELPLFLYGHSMGSFISRLYITRYADGLAGVILSGTAGSNGALGAGKKLAAIVRKMKGEKHHSGLLTMMMFGSYNKKFKDVTSPNAWLTRDESVITQYGNDPYSGFMFTVAAYQDLMELLGQVTSDAWYEKVPVDLPMFVISGSMDPVGGWSDGIYEVDRKLRQKERADLTVKLYKDMRHEIHNEVGKEGVWQDVTDWMEGRL